MYKYILVFCLVCFSPAPLVAADLQTDLPKKNQFAHEEKDFSSMDKGEVSDEVKALVRSLDETKRAKNKDKKRVEDLMKERKAKFKVQEK